MEQHQSTGGTLTLTGEGRVQVKPDLAMINLGVVTDAMTAQEAATKNAELMNKVLTRIKGLKVASEDLQTVGINIAPMVDYDEHSPTYGKNTGYRVEDTLSVKVPVAMAGKVLDEGIAAGASVAGNLSFGLRDESPFRQQALQAAVMASSGDAQTVAQTMGVTLRGAVSVEILYGGNSVLMRSALRAMGPATTVEPGTVTISCSVRMVLRYDNAKPRS